MKSSIIIAVLLLAALCPVFCQDVINNGQIRLGNYDGSVTDTAQWGKKLYLSGVHENADSLWIVRYNRARDQSHLYVCIGNDAPSVKDRFVIGCGDSVMAERKNILVVRADGKVGINTSNLTQALNVNGYVQAKKIKIVATVWADYVFDSSYHLRAIPELIDSIKCNGHLPGMPSATNITAEGIDAAEICRLQQEKIEELFLYMINQQKRKKQLLTLITEQQKKLTALKLYYNK